MAYSGPGDLIAGCTSFWGLRAVNAAKATALGNCMDLIDNAGTSLGTVHFTATGEANLTEITNAVNTATSGSHLPVRCSKLYDQVGAFDMTSASTASAPTITNTTPTGLVSGKVALSFTGAGASQLATASYTAHAQAVTMVFMQLRTSTGQATYNVGSSPAVGMLGANTAVLFAGSLVSTPATVLDTSTTWNTFGGVFNAASSKLFINGSDLTASLTPNANAGAAAPDGSKAFQATNATLDGMITEMGYWNSDISTSLAVYTNPATGNPNDGSVTFWFTAAGAAVTLMGAISL